MTNKLIVNYGIIKTTEDLGRLFRIHRKKESKMTIKDISSMVDLGYRFISEIENGKKTVFLNKTLTYSNLLSLDWYIFPKREITLKRPYGKASSLKEIGDAIKFHRKILEVTIEDAALLTNLTSRVLSFIENGKNINMVNLLSILNNYGMNLIIVKRGYNIRKFKYE